jgi:hypothetical protein
MWLHRLRNTNHYETRQQPSPQTAGVTAPWSRVIMTSSPEYS